MSFPQIKSKVFSHNIVALKWHRLADIPYRTMATILGSIFAKITVPSMCTEIVTVNCYIICMISYNVVTKQLKCYKFYIICHN